MTSQDTALTYDDTGLTNGTTYYYYVTATNSAGSGESSNTISIAPTAEAPRTPLNVKAVQIGF